MGICLNCSRRICLSFHSKYRIVRSQRWFLLLARIALQVVIRVQELKFDLIDNVNVEDSASFVFVL